jgi:hypothetical protein
LRIRELARSVADLRVRTSAAFCIATPAKADSRTRWMEVFFGSSVTRPSARAARRRAEYVAATFGARSRKCAATAAEVGLARIATDLPLNSDPKKGMTLRGSA